MFLCTLESLDMEKKDIYTKDAIGFLTTYLNNPSPSGKEYEGQKIWMNYIKPYVDDFISDTYGTVIGVINPKAEYKVVIEGHADEISWRVNYITKKGLIYVLPNGGSDYQIATSKTVNILTREGVVKGIFGWPAIQMREKKKEKSPQADSIFIDVGCSTKKEVMELGIQIGNLITYTDECFFLNKNKLVSRGLDNRIGGFVIAQVARMLKENNIKLPYGLYIINSVQEEVGKKGAEMITNQLRPNMAIVTDVTSDTTTPTVNKRKEGLVEIGKGPVVLYAPSVHNILQELILQTAQDYKIPIQHSAKAKATGTDTDAFAYGSGGVASALISLPIRYMHTSKEMAHKMDVENLVKLIYLILQKIKGNENFKFFENTKILADSKK